MKKLYISFPSISVALLWLSSLVLVVESSTPVETAYIPKTSFSEVFRSDAIVRRKKRSELNPTKKKEDRMLWVKVANDHKDDVTPEATDDTEMTASLGVQTLHGTTGKTENGGGNLRQHGGTQDKNEQQDDSTGTTTTTETVSVEKAVPSRPEAKHAGVEPEAAESKSDGGDIEPQGGDDVEPQNEPLDEQAPASVTSEGGDVANVQQEDKGEGSESGGKKMPTSASILTGTTPQDASDTTSSEHFEWWENEYCDEETELPIIVFMRSDSYSSEEQSVLIYEHMSDEYEMIPTGDIENDQLFNEQVCVPKDSCFEFYLLDNVGDGFTTGGLYLDAGGVNMLDIRPQSTGKVNGDGTQFFASYFGEQCDSIFPERFGELDEISDAAMDIILTDGIDVAPVIISSCEGTNTVEVQMHFVVDAYSKFDNGVALFDVSKVTSEGVSELDSYIWAYDPGSFLEHSGTEYIWSACVDRNACSEFEFYDAFGDDLCSPGSLKLYVDGVEVLNVGPSDAEGDNCGSVRSRNSPEASVYTVDIGTCVAAQSNN